MMKNINAKKWIWIGPALVLLSGIFNLMNPELEKELVYIWYVLTPIAAVLTMVSIIRIYKQTEG